MARQYSSTASEATLNAGIDAAATSMQVASATGYPASPPFTAVLDPDTSSEEIVTVTVRVGATWTISRGQDGTVALPHSTGAKIRHMITARDLREPQEHIDATSGVHGTTGALVGSSQTQTLTNKTISGSSNTLTNIATSSVTGLSGHIASGTQVHGLESGDGAVVGSLATVTLQNKTISGSNNTLNNVAQSSVVGLTSALAKIAGISNIACGFTEDVSFSAIGNGTISHNVGFTPTVMIFQPIVSVGVITVNKRLDGSMSSTFVNVRANDANGPWEGTLDIFWIAVRSA